MFAEEQGTSVAGSVGSIARGMNVLIVIIVFCANAQKFVGQWLEEMSEVGFLSNFFWKFPFVFLQPRGCQSF
jgi:hypothetical protein